MTTPVPGGSEAKGRAYRFSPRPTRGLLLGLHPGQLVLVAAGCAVLVIGLSRGWLGAGLGLLAGSACGVVALAPLPSGSRADLRLVLLARHLTRRLSGVAETRVDVTGPGELQLPPPLHRLRLIGVALPDGGEVGVLVDGAAGRYTALLAVSGASFTLGDPDDQARRVAGWGRSLAALAREGSALARVQWLARTSPVAGNDLLAHWLAAGQHDGSLAASSYEQLVSVTGPSAPAHETVLAACLEAGRARRTIRRVQRGEPPVRVLLRELAWLADLLTAADVRVAGAVPPRGVARLLRAAYDPAAQRGIDSRSAADAGVAVGAAGPCGTETRWDCLRTDSGWHATYWVAEWPRAAVGADFLAPLLLAEGVRHAVALVAEPLPSGTATRRLAAARTAETANAALRSRVGQLTSERQRAEAEEVDRRERDLVAGHAVCRYAAFITVTAGDREALTEACGRVEHAAAAAHLELRLLYGQQDTAFMRTLPLAYPPC